MVFNKPQQTALLAIGFRLANPPYQAEWKSSSGVKIIITRSKTKGYHVTHTAAQDYGQRYGTFERALFEAGTIRGKYREKILALRKASLQNADPIILTETHMGYRDI